MAAMYLVIAESEGKEKAYDGFLKMLMQRISPTAHGSIYDINNLKKVEGDIFANFCKLNRRLFENGNAKGLYGVEEIRDSENLQYVRVTKCLNIDAFSAIECPELARLGEILPNLIQPYPAMARFEKAERLANLTGQELESMELICDLRPIFDEDRKQIEGMMPYTRLHIVATGADGLPKSFEAELTHQQVIDLRKKGEKAESKLAVLRKSVESWLPGRLPDLPLTRVVRKESSDA